MWHKKYKSFSDIILIMITILLIYFSTFPVKISSNNWFEIKYKKKFYLNFILKVSLFIMINVYKYNTVIFNKKQIIFILN